jgi:AAA15 family ATPase/GTPase
MKIREIRIENFRSIKRTDFKTSDFNIFVGQNNCGKTNFFEALEFFFNGMGRGWII